MLERPAIISPDVTTLGIPAVYRLRGSSIEFLPTPQDEYDILVWYVPATSQLASDVGQLRHHQPARRLHHRVRRSVHRDQGQELGLGRAVQGAHRRDDAGDRSARPQP